MVTGFGRKAHDARRKAHDLRTYERTGPRGKGVKGKGNVLRVIGYGVRIESCSPYVLRNYVLFPPDVLRDFCIIPDSCKDISKTQA